MVLSKQLAIPIGLGLAFIATPAQAHIPAPKLICDSWHNYRYPAGIEIDVFPTYQSRSDLPPLIIGPICFHKTNNFREFEVDN